MSNVVPMFTISDVSKRLNVTYRTLHYYEEKLSLIINRNSSGDRVYSEKDIELFKIILDLKAKGMTLAGIKKFLIDNNFISLNNVSCLTPIEQIEYYNAVLKNDIKSFFINNFQTLTDEIKLLREEQEKLKENMNVFIRQSADHYDKFDKYISEWRERKKRQPWYIKLFNRTL